MSSKRRRLNEDIAAKSSVATSRVRQQTPICLLPGVLQQLITTFLDLADHERVARTCSMLHESCKKATSFCPINDVSHEFGIEEGALFPLILEFTGSRIEWTMDVDQIEVFRHADIRITGISNLHNADADEIARLLDTWTPRYPVRRLDLSDCCRIRHCLRKFRSTVHELKIATGGQDKQSAMLRELTELRKLDLTWATASRKGKLAPELVLPPSLTALRLTLQDVKASTPVGIHDWPLVALSCSNACVQSITKTAKPLLSCLELQIEKACLPLPYNFKDVFSKLRILRFTRRRGTNLRPLVDMQLTELDMQDSIESDEIPPSELRNLPKTLQQLRLASCDVCTDLGHLTELTRLTVFASVVDLRCLESLSSLVTLVFSECTVKNGESLPTKRLQYLELRDTNGVTVRQILACRQLRSLTIGHRSVGKGTCNMCDPNSSRDIGNLGELQHLHTLDIDDCRISMEAAISIASRAPLVSADWTIRHDNRLDIILKERNISGEMDYRSGLGDYISVPRGGI